VGGKDEAMFTSQRSHASDECPDIYRFCIGEGGAAKSNQVAFSQFPDISALEIDCLAPSGYRFDGSTDCLRYLFGIARLGKIDNFALQILSWRLFQHNGTSS